MREILFRGKTADGEWYVGKGVNLCWSSAFILQEYVIKSTGVKVCDDIEVDPSTVGQFTGLTDKNGKKIFEGDIVAQNWYDHDEPADDSFGEVVFCEYDCSFSVMDVNKDGIVPLGRCHAFHWEAEVIGNIHDNPELLEVSQ